MWISKNKLEFIKQSAEMESYIRGVRHAQEVDQDDEIKKLKKQVKKLKKIVREGY